MASLLKREISNIPSNISNVLGFDCPKRVSRDFKENSYPDRKAKSR